jgi:hypothetical protein
VIAPAVTVAPRAIVAAKNMKHALAAGIRSQARKNRIAEIVIAI